MTIPKTFSDGTTWPRIYSTTLSDRMLMPPEELEALWKEYRSFWLGHTTVQTTCPEAVLDREYQADWLEDRDGDFR